MSIDMGVEPIDGSISVCAIVCRSSRTTLRSVVPM